MNPLLLLIPVAALGAFALFRPEAKASSTSPAPAAQPLRAWAHFVTTGDGVRYRLEVFPASLPDDQVVARVADALGVAPPDLVLAASAPYTGSKRVHASSTGEAEGLNEVVKKFQHFIGDRSTAGTRPLLGKR